MTREIFEQATQADQQAGNTSTTGSTPMQNIALVLRNGLIATRQRTLTEISKALAAIESCETRLEEQHKLIDKAVTVSEGAHMNSYVAATNVKNLDKTLTKTDTRINDMLDLLKELRNELNERKGDVPRLTEVITALEQRVTDLGNLMDTLPKEGPEPTEPTTAPKEQAIPIHLGTHFETPKPGFASRIRFPPENTTFASGFPAEPSIRYESTRRREDPTQEDSPGPLSRRTSPSPNPHQRGRTQTREVTRETNHTVNQTTTSGADIPKEARAKKPDPYSGRKGQEAENFLMKMNLYFGDYPEGTFNDYRKMTLTLTNMKEGEASNWALPLLQRLTTGKTHEFTKSWESLQNALLTNFSDPIKKDKAIRDLSKLTQTKSTQSYATQFRILAQEIGWDQKALIDKFKEGLKAEVRQELQRIVMYSDDQEMTLEQWIAIACKADDLIFSNQKLNATGKSSASSNPQWSKAKTFGNATAQTTKGKEVVKVPEAEKDRRRKEKLCIKCGKSGHQVKDCRGNWTYEKHKIQGKASVEVVDDDESEN
jgi:polyhydroxyalkanoate synthesis regulator phasin